MLDKSEYLAIWEPIKFSLLEGNNHLTNGSYWMIVIDSDRSRAR